MLQSNALPRALDVASVGTSQNRGVIRLDRRSSVRHFALISAAAAAAIVTVIVVAAVLAVRAVSCMQLRLLQLLLTHLFQELSCPIAVGEIGVRVQQAIPGDGIQVNLVTLHVLENLGTPGDVPAHREGVHD